MSTAEAQFDGFDLKQGITRKPRSPLYYAWVSLIQNKLAIGSGIFLILLILAAVFAGLIAPEGIDDQKLKDNYLAPGQTSLVDPDTSYLLGADRFGRDILTRVIYGARVSLSVAIVASLVSLSIGLTYGLISGYFGGAVDNAMMRVVDILYGFPFLIFVILLQVYFKAVASRGGAGVIAQPLVQLDRKMGGMFFIFLALGALNWIGMARIARGQVLSYKEKEFVEGARMIGASDMRIIFRHLLPNILGPCIVSETMAIPGYIFTESFLSFIGLGVNAPTPSWGIMIDSGYRAMRAHPHVLWPPAIALVLTTLAFNFFGDGLRDAFDPRMKGTF
ncbi:MAG: ABC transporter permease [Anaerolineae bacterium]|nr:ABC transporter permease [Anaerolineae bacterium]